MGFCGKCGFKLDGGFAFCPCCGASTELPSRRAGGAPSATAPKPAASQESTSGFAPDPEPGQSFASEPGPPSRKNQVKRCPACGEIVNDRDAVCPACGYEIHDAPDGTVQELYKQLQAIENARPDKGLLESEGHTATDEKLATVIRNFPVPSNKEDLVELIVMANSNSCWDEENAESKPAPSAWRAKFDQAYSRLEIYYGNSDEFQRFRDMKAEGQRRASGIKKSNMTLMLGLFLFLLLMMLVAELPLIFK